MVYNEVVDDSIVIDLTEAQIISVPKPQQSKIVTPSQNKQLVEADEGYELSDVTIEPVTAEIDSNIQENNIRQGVTILGKVGNLAPDKPDQTKIAYPSEVEQSIKADNGYELSEVLLKPINIEKISIVPTIENQVINASEGKYIKEVNVDAINAQSITIKPSSEEQNIGAPENVFYDNIKVEATENLDIELDEQEILLAELESEVNELPDKPVDSLQYKCDNIKSLDYEFNLVGTNYGKDSPDEYVINIMKNIDTSEVVSMNYMFQSSKVTDLSSITINAKNCKSMDSMFRSSTIKKFPKIINSKNVTNMNAMFYGCVYSSDDIQTFDLDTSSATSFQNMFTSSKFKYLDLSNFKTSQVNNMQSMFTDSYSIVHLNISGWDTSSLTNMYYMFRACKFKILDLTGWDTSKVTKMDQLFASCDELETVIGTIDLISNKGITGNSFGGGCKKLKDMTLKNICKTSLSMGDRTSFGTLLTDETIINTFKELWDNTDNVLGGTRTLTLSTPSNARTEAIYVKLIGITDEMRAEDEYIDNKKPCVVCESTDEGAMTLKEYGISKNWNIA